MEIIGELKKMSNFSKRLNSRVGTCGSGRHFDIWYDLKDEELETFTSLFELNDLVDVFCMCEASIVHIENQRSKYLDDESVSKLIQFLWLSDNYTNIKPSLFNLGLRTSPD